MKKGAVSYAERVRRSKTRRQMFNMQRTIMMAFYEPVFMQEAKLIVLTRGQMNGLRSWLRRLERAQQNQI